MSQEGGNLPQDAQEIHGGTASTITPDTPVEPAKMSCSNSSSSSGKTLVTGDENNNAVSKPAASLVVNGDVAETEGKGKSVVVEGEGGGAAGGGDGSNNGTSESVKSKLSSSDDEGDDELRDLVAAAAAGGGSSGDVKEKDAAVVHALHVWTERERRKKMKTMFHRLQTLLPRLPEKSDKVTIVDEAISYIKTLQGAIQRLERLKMERDLEQQLAAAVANGATGEGSTPAPPPAGASMTTPLPLPVVTRESTLADLVHGWNNAAQDAAAGGGQQQLAAPAVTPPPLQTWSGRNMSVSITGDDAFLTLSLPRRQELVTTVLSVLEKHHIDVVTATVMTEQDSCLFSLHVQLDPAGCSSETLTSEDKYKLAVSELMLWLSN
ncbi:hypothetical protein GUJ93_ZPchr0025g2900 [Zizania palustris]|uniref:BHLH domain-containing protein n=1 Tax=Zizania palustris TaxID=103762 RepID=A0A8J5QP56_ZIZPA|nr:hypothetical protein GUJ93_ZPchr0025g2900 [Zizania palustris]